MIAPIQFLRSTSLLSNEAAETILLQFALHCYSVCARIELPNHDEIDLVTRLGKIDLACVPFCLNGRCFDLSLAALPESADLNAVGNLRRRRKRYLGWRCRRLGDWWLRG
jgi:hypothetical protein